MGTIQHDALQNLQGSIEQIRTRLNHEFGASGAFTGSLGPWSRDSNDGGMYTANFYFNAANVARTSTETRPYNMALMYLMRASALPSEPNVSTTPTNQVR